jgi:uncharacterized membrane protein
METEHLSSELSDQDKLLLVLGYLGPLAFLSMITSRREFVKWHARQGLLLAGVLAIAYIFLRAFFRFADRYLWMWIADFVWVCLWLAVLGVLAAVVFCISRALEGERFKLPFLGDLADRM